MDIHHLKVFLSVFKNKSFSRASAEINLTQPTVSSHIKAMEDELDCRLFDRIGRTIISTKEAELLYSCASDIAERLEDIKTTIGLLKEEIKGELIIGASTIPGTYVIPSIIPEFKKKYPAVSFRVVIGDSGKITDMVSGNELLIGVVGAKMDHGKIEYLNFLEDELILISHPKFFRKKIISENELADIPFLIREEGSGTRKVMEKYLAERNIGLKDLCIPAILGSTDAVKEAVKSGLGVSILSRIAVKSETRSGLLKETRIKGLNMKRNFYIITHKKRTLPKIYRLFFDYLKTKSQSIFSL
ncbi:MAG: LysR family transcriptional regulator [Nitrospirae bacterium]|nr:LysR family transcriptional regulator [Nitrospirota bacterium]